MGARRAERNQVCAACGAEHGPEAWLCDCGHDLRDSGGVGERFAQARSAQPLRRLLGPPLGLGALGGGLGFLAGAAGPGGFFGRNFDELVYAVLGAGVGSALGLVVSIVLFVTRPRR
jgi:hypothetical protein